MTSDSSSTCTRCGCTCNDLALRLEQNRIVAADNACDMGERWFRQDRTKNNIACEVAGKAVTVAAGIKRALEILAAARYPLVYGLGNSTTDGQRLAIAIAEELGGAIDTPNSQLRGPGATTFRGVGEVTATLGEIKNRSDVVVFWRCNPAKTHPRHLELYSLLPEGEFLPNGRDDRLCVVVDQQPTETAKFADHFVRLAASCDLEAIWTMRGILAGMALDPQQVKQATGVPLADWQQLVDQLRHAKYAAIFFDAQLARGPTGYVQVEALQAFIKELNREARAVGRSLGSAGNIHGAEQVLTWTTGYPAAVDFSRGYPRYSPGEFTADALLARKEVDAALIVGRDSMANLSDAAQSHLQRIPTISIDDQGWSPQSSSPDSRSSSWSPTVAFFTAIPGIHTSGTTYRVDGVALPLRAALQTTLSSQVEILTQIAKALKPI